MTLVSELRSGSGHAKEMSYEERGKAMNELFIEKIVPLV